MTDISLAPSNSTSTTTNVSPTKDSLTTTAPSTPPPAPQTPTNQRNSNASVSSTPSMINTSLILSPTVAAIPHPWVPDSSQNYCYSCSTEFSPPSTAPNGDVLSRLLSGGSSRHHCRSCGFIFCDNCTSKKCLIHPSNIVIRGISLKGSMTVDDAQSRHEKQMACREPQRVCAKCFESLKGEQEELRCQYSNSQRFNSVTANQNWWNRTFGNSPIAFTLGHEIRKASQTLSNLLPLPKRSPSTILDSDFGSEEFGSQPFTQTPDLRKIMKESCNGASSNLRELDGVRIPARLLEKAKGIAVVTVARGGFWVGGEFGSGLVIARLADGSWSAPSAVGLIGFSVGALIGVSVSDHVFLLMSDKAVEMLGTSTGSINLGADVGVAIGPVGRSVEADVGVTDGGAAEPSAAPIYTYSLTKGLYAGVSFDGKVIATRHDVNEKFYGMAVDPEALLSGGVPQPPAAQPLYESLKRVSVYTKSEFGEAYEPKEEEEGAHGIAGVRLGAVGGVVEEKKLDGVGVGLGVVGGVVNEKNENDGGVQGLTQQEQEVGTGGMGGTGGGVPQKTKTFEGDWPF
ncbi:hypothetical protein TL16_g09960 [Triparma laevis f. inornata]|uniref:FYVE-type domain-containing protein n=2 Tax=Triparma laevis TaxID=1534972 RepID=A0A9W7CMN1_9STRA|nr:hypothetical protein TL16_g09960 [Triparma laevis f. inornata]GMI07439.1 hypothetical protein TrLO_g7596 [Triparma laevis f. longispina]